LLVAVTAIFISDRFYFFKIVPGQGITDQLMHADNLIHGKAIIGDDLGEL
jgi:hypothetical protein